MKALTITEPGKTDILTRPDPVPSDDEVLLKVERVGFCGTDLSTYLGKNPLVTYPRIPGHEITGVVEKTGSEVPKFIRGGLNATVLPYTSCGTCAACRRGVFNACRFNETLGVQRDGALTEFIALPWNKLVLSENSNPEDTVLTEPLAVGFHAADRGGITDIDTVLVIGCGMVGLGAIARSALRGARTIAADIDDDKLKIAHELGAVHSINSKTSDLIDGLMDLTKGDGPDVVIEAVGHPLTYRSAVEAVAFTGRLVCIGYAKEDAALPTRIFVQKELSIRGSRNSTRSDFEAVTRFLQLHKLPIGSMITRRVELQEAGDALAEWAQNPPSVMRIVVEL